MESSRVEKRRRGRDSDASRTLGMSLYDARFPLACRLLSRDVPAPRGRSPPPSRLHSGPDESFHFVLSASVALD